MTFQDPDFGTVTVTVNPRARSIIMRPQVDGLRVTACAGASLKVVMSTIDKYRNRLVAKQHEIQKKGVSTPDEVECMRREAKIHLVRRTAELASMHGFCYSNISIRSSKSRWGSCSGRNSISLSLFLMKIPQRLQDYVILHELCHTVHHDHSPLFWQLLNTVTHGQAFQLRRELKQYDTL